MKQVKKLVTIILLIVGISMLLSGCEKIYTEKERIKFAQKKLSEKYGEEFKVTEVFNVQGNVFHVYAYSVNRPNVIFDASCVMGSSTLGYDYYIEELVAEQYKALVDEQLVDFGYDYYIDSWCANIDDDSAPIMDTSMTIEEYNELSEHEPKFNIYFSKEVLAEDNETLYELLKKVTSTTDCLLGFYVVTEEDLEKVRDEYSKRSIRSFEFHDYLETQYNISAQRAEDRGYFGFRSIDGEWNRTEEDFYKIMEVIRSNELFK